jgi:hypothetical protein
LCFKGVLEHLRFSFTSNALRCRRRYFTLLNDVKRRVLQAKKVLFGLAAGQKNANQNKGIFFPSYGKKTKEKTRGAS